jgi:hypothetical protein
MPESTVRNIIKHAGKIRETCKFCNHTDTEIQNSGLKSIKEEHTKKIGTKKLWKGGSTIVGYVPT